MTRRTQPARAALVAALAIALAALVWVGVSSAQDAPPADGDPAPTEPAEPTEPAAPPAGDAAPDGATDDSADAATDTTADDASPADAGEPIGEVGVVGETDAPTDPGDRIVTYIDGMTSVVRENLNDPAKVKAELKTYIEDNAKGMREAGDEFEKRLNDLPVDEREAYQERLQRKMEASLATFFEVMIDFSERHPDDAKELDEMLQAMK